MQTPETVCHRHLPGTYGMLTVRESVDHDTATVTYRVHAPHISGAFVALPSWTALNSRLLLPDGVDLHMGIGPEYERSNTRTDRPTVYGISLTGVCMVDPVEWLSRPEPRYGFRRAIGTHDSHSVPDGTNKLTLAVVTVLLILWTSRPDREQLARTRARRRAAAKLAELRHGPIRFAEAEIVKITTELKGHYAYAAELEALAAEHQALTAALQEPIP